MIDARPPDVVRVRVAALDRPVLVSRATLARHRPVQRATVITNFFQKQIYTHYFFSLLIVLLGVRRWLRNVFVSTFDILL